MKCDVEIKCVMKRFLKPTTKSQLQRILPGYKKHKSSKFDAITPVPRHNELNNKIVILIGCEYTAYESRGTMTRLPGCHMDIKLMEEMLIQHYGYKSTDFIILSDANATFLQPTRQNIMATLTEIIHRKNISQLVIYYSGHGTQTKDRFYHSHSKITNHEEEKTQNSNHVLRRPKAHAEQNDDYHNIVKYLKTLYVLEDCVVPCDYLEAGLISDVSFHTQFWSKISISTKVTAIFDSCNSGSIFDLPFRYKGDNMLEDDVSMRPEKRVKPLPLVVTISGCRDDQNSVSICGTENQMQWQGCMSFAFRQVLKSHNYKYVGLNTIIDEMRVLLRNSKYTQVPQMGLSHNIMPSSVIQLF